MLGKAIGPYTILEKIGQGGMGTVYKGLHTQLEQEVAIKVLSPAYAQDASMRERFFHEAKIQAKLTHPHVVNIFNYLEDDGNVFLIMEYIQGETLEQRLASAGSIPPAEAVSICQGVLAALSFMHAKGIVHRDIKPGNIMFTATGLVKVTDFGIAKVAGQKGQTLTGMRIGTLWYMSPEQIQGQPASVASDVYALGMTLFQMVTGKLPFKGDSEYSVLRGHMEEMPALPWEMNHRVSRELGQVILKALEKKPEHRYHNARDFAEALAAMAQRPHESEADASVPLSLRPTRLPAWPLNRWQYVTLCAGVGVLIASMCYFAFFYHGRKIPIPLALHLPPSITGFSASIAGLKLPPREPDLKSALPGPAPIEVTKVVTEIASSGASSSTADILPQPRASSLAEEQSPREGHAHIPSPSETPAHLPTAVLPPPEQASEGRDAPEGIQPPNLPEADTTPQRDPGSKGPREQQVRQVNKPIQTARREREMRTKEEAKSVPNSQGHHTAQEATKGVQGWYIRK
jgi:serine/threonine protein kinase